MAVRTTRVGIKRTKEVGAHAAQPSQQPSKGKHTLFHDEEEALRRKQVLERVTLGPAARKHGPKSNRRPARVQGRKKPPSQMNVKRSGG